jgi:hypothetical protein
LAVKVGDELWGFDESHRAGIWYGDGEEVNRGGRLVAISKTKLDSTSTFGEQRGEIDEQDDTSRYQRSRLKRR